jgi:hypothetical protein
MKGYRITYICLDQWDFCVPDQDFVMDSESNYHDKNSDLQYMKFKAFCI